MEGAVVHPLLDRAGGAGLELGRGVVRPPPVRGRVPGDAPLEVVGPRLDDGVDDPAEGLPVLRFETAGLDLDLVQELAGHAGTQGAVHDVVRADSPEPGVGDVHAVDQVGVLQAGRAADRIVALTGAESAHHTRRDGVGIGERSPQRHRVRDYAKLALWEIYQLAICVIQKRGGAGCWRELGGKLLGLCNILNNILESLFIKRLGNSAGIHRAHGVVGPSSFVTLHGYLHRQTTIEDD